MLLRHALPTLLGSAALLFGAQSQPSVMELQMQRQQQTFAIGDLQFSGDDFDNQEKITTWVTQAFYSQVRLDHSAWSEVQRDVGQLARAAVEFPSLSLGVAMAIYSYFWWDDTKHATINVVAGREAAALFHRSIQYNSCDSASLPLNDFLVLQCHVRWRYLHMIAAEVAHFVTIHLREARAGAILLREASHYLRAAEDLPFFRIASKGLMRSHDGNFNQDFYPQLNFGPVWKKEFLPLAAFLELHYQDFLTDLHGILDDKTFWDLHYQNQNAETQFGPRDDDWQTVYLVRNQEWSDLNCRHAPRACQLLQTRPEIANCAMGGAGSGFLRLRPGARLKPHYGNAPRLSAHLGLIVPEAGDIHMNVGNKVVRWEAGKVIVFDDTYIHSVSHDGLEARFVLNVWLCHPCDVEHSHAWQVPEYCSLPRIQ